MPKNIELLYSWILYKIIKHGWLPILHHSVFLKKTWSLNVFPKFHLKQRHLPQVEGRSWSRSRQQRRNSLPSDHQLSEILYILSLWWRQSWTCTLRSCNSGYLCLPGTQMNRHFECITRLRKCLDPSIVCFGKTRTFVKFHPLSITKFWYKFIGSQIIHISYSFELFRLNSTRCTFWELKSSWNLKSSNLHLL